LKSRDLTKVEKALETSYLKPQNSNRYIEAFQVLEASQLYELSYKYAKIAVEFNPESFDAWTILYYSQKATVEERALAKENLLRLDPRNPSIFDLPQK
jgi:hypothetical protein